MTTPTSIPGAGGSARAHDGPTTTTGDLVLARHAGPLAVGAGALLVLADLTRWVAPKDARAVASHPVTVLGNAGYAVALALLAVALAAVYLRHAGSTGSSGAVAFAVALIGVVEFGGNMWFDGFAAPWIAEVAPQAFTAERTTLLEVGGLSSYLLFALGWLLFGAVALRARVVPWPIGVAFLVSGVLGVGAGVPPCGVPIGLTFVALGCWLTRGRERRGAHGAGRRRNGA